MKLLFLSLAQQWTYWQTKWTERFTMLLVSGLFLSRYKLMKPKIEIPFFFLKILINYICTNLSRVILYLHSILQLLYFHFCTFLLYMHTLSLLWITFQNIFLKNAPPTRKFRNSSHYQGHIMRNFLNMLC